MANGFRLVMGQGPEPGQTFNLDRDALTIGRDPSNGIAINEPQISRQHARITRQGGLMVIEDLGSTNGTFVNGMRLTGPHTLANGDAIGLGNSVTLTFQGTAAPVADTMAGQPEAVPPQSYGPPPAAPPYSPPAYAAAPAADVPAFEYEEYEEVEEEEKKSKTGLYIGCGCLALVLICVAVAAFVWFAPASFWEALVDFGIPVPSNPF